LSDHATGHVRALLREHGIETAYIESIPGRSPGTYVTTVRPPLNVATWSTEERARVEAALRTLPVPEIRPSVGHRLIVIWGK
jgi:sugar/nucleoside kinase (ribokinase family)